mmetsp:Transcript_100872/g.289975  ORF Transcript_100872/g.289975 Transcript_100872/m.289975 type:complete len:297 (-) Transcript_100872:19-909(-)
MTDKTKMKLPKVWHMVNQGSLDCDPENKQALQQMYSGVAELYHNYRPGYSDDLVEEAFEKCKLLKNKAKAKVLELGCGPGTLTSTLARRGLDIVALDPGVGMIEKARQVCKEYPNVQLLQTTFKDFTSDDKFDAIIAATSMHWVLAETDKEKLIEKLSNHLKEDGSLILFWNFAPEPSEELLDKVADALNQPKPFHFSNGSVAAHSERMREHTLEPLETSLYFSPFETMIHTIDENVRLESYINFLQTMSNFISMENDERELVLGTARKILGEDSGEMVTTRRFTMINISSKRNTK